MFAPIYIALDTSALEAERYDFSGSHALRGLVKVVQAGAAVVLIVDVVDQEVRAHFPELAKSAIGHLGKAQKELKRSLLAQAAGVIDIRGILKTISDISCDRELAAVLERKWSEFLDDANAVVLPASDVNSGEVLRQYFAKTAPFSVKKPKEFPDAFQIERLRMWQQENSQAVHLVSTDPDIAAACDGTMLIHLKRIAPAVALVFATSNVLLAERVNSYLHNKREWVGERLDEYIRDMQVVIDEDWEAEVEDVEVKMLRAVDYNVVEISEGLVAVEGDGQVEIGFTATVGDYGSSPVDGGEYVFVYQDTVKVAAVVDVRFDLDVRVEGDGKEKCPVAIENVTVTEPKNIEVSLEESDVETLSSWRDDPGPEA